MDAPSICAQCLGDKQHLKMIRQVSGEECKVCTRPFTVFRWNKLNELRQLNKTIICQTCARARNCCQSCMMDITYGIPLDIRDAALKMAGIPNEYAVESTSRNREVKAIIADKQESKKKKEINDDKVGKAKVILETLAAKLSTAKRSTTREKPRDTPTNKDTAKIVSRLPFGGNLVPPQDSSIKSFFIFGFSADMPQYVLSDYCGKYGTVSQTKVVHRARCGFVTFSTRKSAEALANDVTTSRLNKSSKTAGLVLLDGKYPVRIAWGSPKPLGNTNEEHNKIAIVVAKVMKQLAERDTKPEKKKKEDQKSYRATANDVEL